MGVGQDCMAGMTQKNKGLLINDLGQIDAVNVLTDRVKKRKEAWLKAKPQVSSDRSRIATESWKETEGEHIYLRRAKLFAKICDEVPINIFDDELVVGSQTEHVRGCFLALDYALSTGEEVLAGMTNVGRTEVLKFSVSDLDLDQIKKDINFWKGKTPEELLTRAVEQQFSINYNEFLAPRIVGYRFGEGAPIWARAGDYRKVLRLGLEGIIGDAKARLKALKFENAGDGEAWHFAQAAMITLKGMITYAKRYARLARELADLEKNVQRKKELERIATICDWVPENPVRNFYEAVQSTRFIHLGLRLETAGSNEIVGRLDQYLFPFYEHDIREKILTVQEAAEILACFWLKLNEMESMRPGFWKKADPGDEGTHVTIGGVDRKGNDATNELTYLILKVTQELKLPIAVYVRVHEKTPDELMVRSIEVNRSVAGGIPAFINDKRVIPNLVEDGIAIDDAREYAAFGCVHPNIPHCSGQYAVYPDFNGAKCLELVMYNGRDLRTGKWVGPQTGDPRSFKSTEDWVEAWQKQVRYWYPLFLDIGKFGHHILGQLYALPFNSALLADCLVNGKDVLRGGGRYRQFSPITFCHDRADTADSLTAIKKLIYEDKKITVGDLLDACESNFEGEKHERICQMLLQAPKYGNDEDEPDEMRARLSLWMQRFIRSFRDAYGHPVTVEGNGAASHYRMGQVVGALPNGRKAWEPLSSGAIDPSPGADKKGPTAVIRSASKVVDIHASRSAVFNQKLSPALVNTRENILKVVDMIRVYFEDYLGFQIQYNIVNREQLIAAKSNPEQFRNLVVRVGGYSAYFIELPPILQDDIIARTEQMS
jgi:pyruvate formate-lyase/glycerol dehydratase family glycyl radical enzyme